MCGFSDTFMSHSSASNVRLEDFSNNRRCIPRKANRMFPLSMNMLGLFSMTFEADENQH